MRRHPLLPVALLIPTALSITLLLPIKGHAAFPRDTVVATPPKATPEVKAIMDAGDLLFKASRWEEALKKYTEAVTIARSLNDRPGEGGALNNIGAVYTFTNNNDKALEAFEQSLTVRRAIGDKLGEATTLNNMGRILYEKNETYEAIDSFQESLKIRQAIGDQQGAANTLLNIGVIYRNTGKPGEALNAYQQALPIMKKLGDKDGESKLLNNVGNLYVETGDYKNALQSFEDSLKLKEELKDAPGQAKTLNNIGTIYAEINPPEALKYYNRALPLMVETNDKKGEATTLHNIGFTYLDLGKPEEATEFFTKARTAYQGAGDARGEGVTLQGLGAVALQKGDLPKAQGYFEEAIPLLSSAKDKRSESLVLQGLGALYARQNEPQKALVTYEQARSAFSGLGDRASLGVVLNSIGNLYEALGEHSKALSYFDQSITLKNETGDRSGAAFTLTTAAHIYENSGQLADAERAYGRAITLRESFRDNLTGLSEEVRSSYLAANMDSYQGYLRTLLRGNKVPDAFAAAQKTKARVLLDLMNGGRVDLTGKMTEDEKKQEQALIQKTDELNAAMVTEGVRNEVGSKKRFEAYKAEMVKAEEELSRFHDGIFARYPELATKRVTKTATARDIAQILPDDTALLEYIILPQPVTDAKATKAPGSDIVLFVITQTGGAPNVTSYVLPASADSLAPEIDNFRKACANPKNPWKDAAKTLYTALVGPAAKALEGKTRLVVCPDASLWDVPFAALMDSKGETLLSSYEIDYAYSATGMQAAVAAGKAATPSLTASVLALANPDFGDEKRFTNATRPISAPDRPIAAPDRPLASPDRPLAAPDRPLAAPDRPLAAPDRPLAAPDRPLASPDRPLASPDRPLASPDRPLAAPDRPLAAPDRLLSSPDRVIASPDREGPIDKGTGKLVSLPGTQKEAELLKKEFPNAVILTGSAAQESVAKESAGKFRYLHLATHGFFNDGVPLMSSVILANPAKGSKEDGFLTAREIFDMDLTNVEMTVLSACNTARGEKRSGEGVVGLTWALFAAGCPTQVLSQWAVNDASTAALMESFYTSLSKGEAKGPSLRKAALELSKKGDTEHPYYWAPFVLFGNWK